MRLVDVAGMRFGRLVVLGRESGRDKFGRVRWLCRCDCGQQAHPASGDLRYGRVKSCGCLKRDVAAAMGRATRTHGGNGTPEYKSYVSAKRRCSNPSDSGFHRYGGRGIEFRFDSFEDWYEELGPRPDGLSVDRIDVNGHYEPGNVRWATAKQQAGNRRCQCPDCGLNAGHKKGGLS